VGKSGAPDYVAAVRRVAGTPAIAEVLGVTGVPGHPGRDYVAPVAFVHGQPLIPRQPAQMAQTEVTAAQAEERRAGRARQEALLSGDLLIAHLHNEALGAEAACNSVPLLFERWGDAVRSNVANAFVPSARAKNALRSEDVCIFQNT
jgi:hypothetical protein